MTGNSGKDKGVSIIKRSWRFVMPVNSKRKGGMPGLVKCSSCGHPLTKRDNGRLLCDYCGGKPGILYSTIESSRGI